MKNRRKLFSVVSWIFISSLLETSVGNFSSLFLVRLARRSQHSLVHKLNGTSANDIKLHTVSVNVFYGLKKQLSPVRRDCNVLYDLIKLREKWITLMANLSTFKAESCAITTSFLLSVRSSYPLKCLQGAEEFHKDRDDETCKLISVQVRPFIIRQLYNLYHQVMFIELYLTKNCFLIFKTCYVDQKWALSQPKGKKTLFRD